MPKLENYKSDITLINNINQGDNKLPHDNEAEEILLGALLSDNSAFETLENGLSDFHFFIPMLGRIYKAIFELVNKDQIANPLTLDHYFSDDEAFNEIGGKKYEPMETLVIDVPADFSGKAIELVTQRKGDMLVVEPKGDLQHLEFDIPSRGLIGLRNNMLTATAGNAIMTHRFREYAPYKGEITERMKGSLISMESGSSTAFSIGKLQDRGRFFISPGAEIYKGQVIGENSRNNDLDINVIKGKQLTNMRKSGSDAAIVIAPKIDFSLEESMEYIQADEYLEITPQSLRMRKISYR